MSLAGRPGKRAQPKRDDGRISSAVVLYLARNPLIMLYRSVSLPSPPCTGTRSGHGIRILSAAGHRSDYLELFGMSRFRTALLFTALSLCGTGHAAEPELKVAVVTESRVYERDKASVAVGGIRAAAAKEWVSRVTVAVDGERITGEWVPKTTVSASAKDFPRGTDVRAAARRSQLLLEHPDGSVVTARIVRRVQPKAD